MKRFFEYVADRDIEPDAEFYIEKGRGPDKQKRKPKKKGGWLEGEGSWLDRFKKDKKSQVDDLYDLVKAGEGSRGGVIIGHTSSGKPIYRTRGNKGHKDFTAKDHHEAYVAHNWIKDRLYHHYKEAEKKASENPSGYFAGGKNKHEKKRDKLWKENQHHAEQAGRHLNAAEARKESHKEKIPDYDDSWNKVKIHNKEHLLSVENADAARRKKLQGLG